jgi:anti-anti-sigma factor
MLSISQSESNGVLHIRLSGRLDSLSAPELEERLRDAAVGHVRRFLLDLSDLDYVSSAGLRVFLAFAKLVRRAGGQLAFCGLKDEVRQVFELTGFTDILSISSTADEALRAWTG